MKTPSSHPSSSPQSAPTDDGTTVARAIDPTAPPALSRLIQIGETAGLVTSADQDAIASAFGTPERRRACVGRVLDALQWSETELYVLVTLFSAERHTVSLAGLVRGTLATAGSLRSALNHLEGVDATSPVFLAKEESAVALNPPGRALAVTLMYRVLHSALLHPPYSEFSKSTQSPNHQRNERVEPSVDSSTRRQS